MAHFEDVYEETQSLFNAEIESSMIPRDIRIKIVSNDKLKMVKSFGEVKKQSELNKFIGGYDIIIVINDYVFDQLEPKQKQYIVKDLLGSIQYDMEKDKINIVKHDVSAFSGILLGYEKPIDTYLGIKESSASILEQKEILENNKK